MTNPNLNRVIACADEFADALSNVDRETQIMAVTHLLSKIIARSEPSMADKIATGVNGNP